MEPWAVVDLMKVKIDAKLFESALVVILRTPGLFLLDQWWQRYRHDLWLPSNDASSLFPATISILMACGGFLVASLHLESLVAVYMHLFSGVLLVMADFLSRYYILMEHDFAMDDPKEAAVRHAAALASHVVIASMISFLLDVKDEKKPFLFVIYSSPVVARIAGLPVKSLLLVHNIVSAAVALIVLYYFITTIGPALVEWAKERWDEVVGTRHVDGATFILDASGAADEHVCNEFLLLWVYLFVSNLYVGRSSHVGLPWYLAALTACSVSCGSPISVIATGIALARISKLVLLAVRTYLSGNLREIFSGGHNDSMSQSGWTEGFTFTLLAFQGGLTGIAMPEKAALMSIILFIVLSSLVQSLFEVTEPVVMALGASEVRMNRVALAKHARAVLLCLVLIGFPLYMTYVLCQVLDLDFWSLVVISTCLVTSVQVFGLIAVYCLFVYDMTRSEPWDKLDDVVYAARAMTRVLEFLIALFVVGIGVKESVFATGEDWSLMNCSIVFVHCYFNVWQRLQAGWDSFLRRRAASRKVMSLPLASDFVQSRFNDSCPICFGEMSEDGRILPCRHVFHRTCLQKWFYVQEKCPMCQTPVAFDENDSNAPSHNEDPENLDDS